ncbi:oligopeptide ABC transporter substrate-binding protein OppA [[Acholeplasma] multilocale]|uniref:oligopeptide ABC transporter substrate-binding protein OppA n=1 Tax=[Acholeplasma] multilocale TaxID=264638 RepID=UPI00047ADDDE|nr:oligopeptide ABC transporter substrate-binding protein OppA [[Acholeplasma] multilocale]
MKKLLTSLMALGMVASTATAVVACGPLTNTKLLARKVNTENFRGTFAFPMTTWSHASTQQAEDAIIQTQLQDTLLTPNAVDVFEGSLADWWGSDENSIEWYFNVRDEATWTSMDNGKPEQMGKIGGQGFLDVFRFIFNPNNLSATASSWSTMVAEGAQLTDYINKLVKDFPEYFSQNEGSESNREKQLFKSSVMIDAAILDFNLQYGLWLDNEGGREDEWTQGSGASLEHTRSFTNDSSVFKQMTSKAYVEKLAAKVFTQDKTSNGYKELIKESGLKGGIIRINDKDVTKKTLTKTLKDGSSAEYNLTFRIQKPAPYFESIAAFLSFAPMPPKSVDYSRPLSAGNAYGEGPTKLWYSGAYIVEDYNPSQIIKLVQNPYYFNKEKAYIKTQTYNFLGGADVSKPRLLFEAGDISEVTIQSTDYSGWKRYVGEDMFNPVFEGTHAVAKPAQSAGTFFQLFNYGRFDGKENLTESSKALSQKSVRGYLSYFLERSELVSYYSQAMDGESNERDVDGKIVAQLVRNRYTPKDFVYDAKNNNKDYGAYIDEVYRENVVEKAAETLLADKTGENVIENALKYSNLDDGFDPFKKNDFMAYNLFKTEYGTGLAADTKAKLEQQDQELLLKFSEGVLASYDNDGNLVKGEARVQAEKVKMEALKQKVKNDLQNVIGKNSITLDYILNGANNSTLNININNMIDLFNRDHSDVIKIDKLIAVDASDYRTKMSSGTFDITSNGWTPDYTDPYNFLETIGWEGSYEVYQNLTKIFSDPSKKQEPIEKEVFKLNYNEKISDSLKPFYDEFKSRFETFVNDIKNTDKDGNPSTRYPGFAGSEVSALYLNYFITPLFVKSPKEALMLSYTDPFTRAAFPSGGSQYRLFGAKMTQQLMTAKEYSDRQAASAAVRNNDLVADLTEVQKVYYNEYSQHIWDYSENSGEVVQ